MGKVAELELSCECSTGAEDDGCCCTRENFGAEPLAPPRYIKLPAQAVTSTPTPASLLLSLLSS